VGCWWTLDLHLPLVGSIQRAGIPSCSMHETCVVERIAQVYAHELSLWTVVEALSEVGILGENGC
jgi:hypothetical protein